MKTANEKLLEWVINKIEKEYKNDVCLLIGGSTLKLDKDSDGGSFNCFDYFIPANERADNLAKTFIVEGIGYDLYPRSWERIEQMANLDDYNTTCLDYKILYYRNEEDKKRFLDMQAKLHENLQNPEFMFKKALEKLNVAMELYQTVMFEEAIGKVRMAAGFIADFLSVAVACINQTYFKKSQIEQIAELSVMKAIPEKFTDYYKAIINATTDAELKELSRLMIQSTRKFLSERKEKNTAATSINFKNLADWYQELCYTWRRIYHECDQNDIEKAFIWGCMLQHELDIIKEEYCLDEMDLFGCFNAKNLLPFRKKAEEVEKYICGVLEKNGIKLESYETVDEFIANNS